MLYIEGPENSAEYHRLQFSNVKTLEEARQRFLEYVTFYSRHNHAVALSSLNRLFGVRVKTLGSRVSDLVGTLLAEGSLGAVQNGNRTWLYSIAVLSEMTEGAPDPWSANRNLIEGWIKTAKN